MASRYSAETPKDSYVRTTISEPVTTTTSENRSFYKDESSREIQSNLTKRQLADLENLITLLQAGGTPEIRASRAKRDQAIQLANYLLNLVSPQKAFDDAQALMALNLQQSMEKNMPAIAKAVEGAGTSASSMQALLSQKLARDASLAAGALGAQQAATYAAERAKILSILEELTRPNNEATRYLLEAYNIAKGAQTETFRGSTTFGSNKSVSTQETPRTVTTEYFNPYQSY